MRFHIKNKVTGDITMNVQNRHDFTQGLPAGFDSDNELFCQVEIKPVTDSILERLQAISPVWLDQPHPDYAWANQYVMEWEIVTVPIKEIEEQLVEAKDGHLYGNYNRKEQDKHFKHYMMMRDGLMPMDQDYNEFIFLSAQWTDQLSVELKARITALNNGQEPDLENWIPRPFATLDDYKASKV